MPSVSSTRRVSLPTTAMSALPTRTRTSSAVFTPNPSASGRSVAARQRARYASSSRPKSVRWPVTPFRTGLRTAEIAARRDALADALFAAIPVGLGSHGTLGLSADEMDAMLTRGTRWAVERVYAGESDLARDQMLHAKPGAVSERARTRQRDEMGTLGSGNHYLEVQRVAEVFAADAARAFGLAEDDVVVMIHCGSRGLGRSRCTTFARSIGVPMTTASQGVRRIVSSRSWTSSAE